MFWLIYIIYIPFNFHANRFEEAEPKSEEQIKREELSEQEALEGLDEQEKLNVLEEINQIKEEFKATDQYMEQMRIKKYEPKVDCIRVQVKPLHNAFLDLEHGMVTAFYPKKESWCLETLLDG